MHSGLDYLLRTENAVRMLLQQNAVCRAKIELVKKNIASDCNRAEKVDAKIKFNDWWIKNKNEQEVIFNAYCQYSAEAFVSSQLAGSVLNIASQAIEVNSSNSTIPDEWTRIFKRRFLPTSFFIGREVHTVPLGLLIYCGRNQYSNIIDRMDESINQEVFGRLADQGQQLEFQALSN